MTLDCSACWLTIDVGDSMKRSLIRHFIAFLKHELQKHGVELDDDIIEGDAWELTDRFISEMKEILAQDPSEGYVRNDRGAYEVVENYVREAMPEFEKQWREGDLVAWKEGQARSNDCFEEGLAVAV